MPQRMRFAALVLAMGVVPLGFVSLREWKRTEDLTPIRPLPEAPLVLAKVGIDDKNCEELKNAKAELAATQQAFQQAMDEFDAKQKEREGKLVRTIEELEAIQRQNNEQEFLALFPFPQETLPPSFVSARTDDMKELEVIKQRNAELEKELIELKKRNAALEKELVQVQKAEKLAQAVVQDTAKRLEDALAKLLVLKGGNLPNEKPPAVLANLRGEVTSVARGQLTLSFGIDGGLDVGSVLDIYRLDGGGRYLGTVKVMNAKDLSPKQAIVTFIPARTVPLEKLKPEELPRKGDEVRPPSVLTGDK